MKIPSKLRGQQIANLPPANTLATTWGLLIVQWIFIQVVASNTSLISDYVASSYEDTYVSVLIYIYII